MCGEIAIPNDFLKTYLEDTDVWTSDIGRYRIDVWLTTRAIVRGANIAEVRLGTKLYKRSPGKQELVLREQVKTLLEQLWLTRDFWKERGEAILPVVGLGFSNSQEPVAPHLDIPSHII